MRRAAITVAFAGALAACNPSPPADAPAPPVANGATNATAKTVRPQIAWPARADATALAALGGDASHVARSPVPVLAPARAKLEDPRVIVDAEYYAISGKMTGATIAIQGTRLAHKYDNIKKIDGDRALRGTHGFVTVNEGIRSASWMENGASYSVDVECRDPVGDVRCTSDAYVLELAESLVFVGGAGESR
jgi:hypothetical protein